MRNKSGQLNAILSEGEEILFHILNAAVRRPTKNGKSVSKREIVLAEIN